MSGVLIGIAVSVLSWLIAHGATEEYIWRRVRPVWKYEMSWRPLVATALAACALTFLTLGMFYRLGILH